MHATLVVERKFIIIGLFNKINKKFVELSEAYGVCQLTKPLYSFNKKIKEYVNLENKL